MKHASKLSSVLGIGLVLTLTAVDTADARRGGSFGSRGARTYSAPRPTQTAPAQTAPVQRSMTPAPKTNAPATAAAPAGAAAAQAQPARRGFLGGMGGGLLGGLVAGGLLGALLGHGFGGLGAGMANTLMQVAIIGLGVFLLMAFLRRRRDGQVPAAAGFGREAMVPDRGPATVTSLFSGPQSHPGPAMFGGGPTAAPAVQAVEIGLVQADRDAFERLLGEVQAAFGREDYAALRAVATPEIVSYLSEELSQNAVQGRRNEVTATKLLEADVAEAWGEGETDYATIAMRYESIDVMRDRQTGAVVDGDPSAPTQTTELWTFVRHGAEPWKLSAIQAA